MDKRPNDEIFGAVGGSVTDPLDVCKSKHGTYTAKPPPPMPKGQPTSDKQPFAKTGG